MKLWFYLPVIGIIALFTIIELGVVASWRNDWSGFSGGYINRVNFISFTTVWTLIGLVVHWALPLIGVAIWAAVTCFWWLIAGSLASSADCVDVSIADFVSIPDQFSGIRRTRLCFGSDSKWQAVQAFAWLLFFSFIALLATLYLHVYRRRDITWRDGPYGKSFIMKPNKAGPSGGIGNTPASAPAPVMTVQQPPMAQSYPPAGGEPKPAYGV